MSLLSSHVFALLYDNRRNYVHTSTTKMHILLKKIFLWPMPLFLLFNTETMHTKSLRTQQHCYVCFPKNLMYTHILLTRDREFRQNNGIKMTNYYSYYNDFRRKKYRDIGFRQIFANLSPKNR
jgi:hypothetical protein